MTTADYTIELINDQAKLIRLAERCQSLQLILKRLNGGIVKENASRSFKLLTAPDGVKQKLPLSTRLPIST